MSYTLEELQILLNLLQESLIDLDDLANTEPLIRATSSLKAIINQGIVQDNIVKEYVCFDDSNLIPQGFNVFLYSASINEIRTKREAATYLGKTIIDWRFKVAQRRHKSNMHSLKKDLIVVKTIVISQLT